MNRLRVIILGLIAVSTAVLTPAAANAAPAAKPSVAAPTISYEVTVHHGGSVGPAKRQTTSFPGAAAIGGIIGNAYSPTGSGWTQINLTRKECYILVCTTDYQAHFKVWWSWNVLAYGGVVYNVTKDMWADHLKATFQQDPPSFTQHFFTYTSHYGNTSPYGGADVDGRMNIKQCVPACVQTETVLAYVHAHDDGSYIEDINHS